jgi:hypothetical protein
MVLARGLPLAPMALVPVARPLSVRCWLTNFARFTCAFARLALRPNGLPRGTLCPGVLSSHTKSRGDRTVKNPVKVEKDWLDNLDRALAVITVDLAVITAYLTPESWQPWQLQRAKIKFALERLADTRKRLEAAMVPFDLKE